MAGEVSVDALPYIDQGYDEPGVREAALSMVDEETRRYRPTKNYLEHLAPLGASVFETPIMKNEYERLQSRQPLEMLSMKRYELPQPPPGKVMDVAAWTESVDNSMAQLEHQATRIINLELMTKYGCESWKMYNATLVQLLAHAQKHLQELRKEIQDVNWRRKQAQTGAGEDLKHLEALWVELVSKNFEIERACSEMENKIAAMERKKQAQQKVENYAADSDEDDDMDE